MITRSDNNAASALWAKLGHSYLQHFLNLAGMKQTVLGPAATGASLRSPRMTRCSCCGCC